MAEELDDTDALTAIELAEGVASIQELKVLHGTLARAMTRRISSGSATAAEWNAVEKFLTNNAISASMGQSAERDALKKRLAERRASRGTIPQDLIAAAEAAADRGLMGE